MKSTSTQQAGVVDWMEQAIPKVKGKQKLPKQVIVSYREDKVAAHTTVNGRGKVARALKRKATP